MKKVLLIGVNAKYIHSNPAVYSLRTYVEAHFNQGATSMPPDALNIVEYTINQSKEAILADMFERKPDVAAFSCYIWNWEMIQSIIEELPKILPGIEIWLGGPEVSFHGEKILDKYPSIKGIMIGEGEVTFTEVMEYYELENRKLEDIPGILLRSGYTKERALTNLDDIPFFYDDLSGFKNRIIYYESQRGCPFSCAYCLSSIDKSVRFKSDDIVEKDLQFFLDNNVPQVKFIDRTFNCNAKHALHILRYIKEHDNGVTNFHFEIAADLLNEEELTLMADLRPGLIQLEIGVQTTNPKTLKEINRYTDLEDLKKKVARINSYKNIHQHLDLIAGLPYEDYESFGHSFDDVYNMKPEQLQLGFLKVLKGSPMEERAKEYGLVYQTRPVYEVLYTKWLSYAEVCRLKGVEEMVEIYYNSNQFTHILPVLLKSFEGPFKMYEALADYYKTNGLFFQTPSRSYRYQVLLNFAKEVNPENEKLYSELLIFDSYLRENCKSRPVFAPSENDNETKDLLRDFYQTKARDFLPDYEQYSSMQMAKMTHIEGFDFSVWEKENVKPLENKQWVLFDYQKRDALTYDAAYFVVGDLSNE